MDEPDDLVTRQRRVVTGHDASGCAVFVRDEEMVGDLWEVPGAKGDRRLSSVEIWGTGMMPVDNGDPAMAGQIIGGRSLPAEAKGRRTMIRVSNLPPGSASPMHRTESIDYAILLKGECDLMLDSGEIKRLITGDIVVQRGTMHSWINRSKETCTWAFILIDAEQVEAGGKKLEGRFDEGPDPTDVPAL